MAAPTRATFNGIECEVGGQPLVGHSSCACLVMQGAQAEIKDLSLSVSVCGSFSSLRAWPSPPASNCQSCSLGPDSACARGDVLSRTYACHVHWLGMQSSSVFTGGCCAAPAVICAMTGTNSGTSLQHSQPLMEGEGTARKAAEGTADDAGTCALTAAPVRVH